MSTIPSFKKEQLWTWQGKPRTSGLFVETCRHGDEPIASLRGNVEGYPCIRDVYVNLTAMDPSEQTFVDAVFDGEMRWWLIVRNSAFFKQFIEEWELLADIKRKQMAFQAVVEEVKNSGRSAFSAAKYLIEEPWKPKDTKTEAKRRATTKEAYRAVNDDVKRLREEGLIN